MGGPGLADATGPLKAAPGSALAGAPAPNDMLGTGGMRGAPAPQPPVAAVQRAEVAAGRRASTIPNPGYTMKSDSSPDGSSMASGVAGSGVYQSGGAGTVTMRLPGGGVVNMPAAQAQRMRANSAAGAGYQPSAAERGSVAAARTRSALSRANARSFDQRSQAMHQRARSRMGSLISNPRSFG
jgi:hypothetical protein